MNLSEVAACLGCEIRNPDIEATGVAIDSRKVKPGDIFFCLPGERVDGHDFAQAAVAKGAICIIATRDLPELAAPILKVPDSEQALGQLAKCWRGRMQGNVICITGTAGKTTLKDMLAPILECDGKCAATTGNFNNQIGLPLTILNTDGDERYLLLEAGISHAGDMDYLADICKPDLAIILNVGEGHTDGLGRRGVAWHKTRLLKYLTPGGRALINADYPELVSEARATGASLCLFGNKEEKVDYGPCLETADGFSIRHGSEHISFTVGTNSPAMAETLLAAVSVARELGITDEKIRAGLRLARQPEHRFEMHEWDNQIVIDDCYNANPLSMRRSLTRAAREAQTRNLALVAILGEMGELGAGAEAAHAELGRLLCEIRPAAVFWKGQWFAQIAAGYAGVVHKLGGPADFPKQLAEAHLPEKAVLIFKGSRLNRLEEYLAQMLPGNLQRRPDVL